jgi:hypothetical protein
MTKPQTWRERERFGNATVSSRRALAHRLRAAGMANEIDGVDILRMTNGAAVELWDRLIAKNGPTA